jgi:DNA-binding LytR/AlgR family response regulator
MNCLIVDDEPLAQDLVANFIAKIPYLQLVGKCKNALEAGEILKKQSVDLLFLDIHMPDISGIEFVKNGEHLPMIIFTTAYSHYAMEGFEYNAVDYLLKPFSFQRFVKAVTRAFGLYNLKTKSRDNSIKKDYIFVNSDYKLVKLNFSEILYIEGLKDYIKIITTDSKPILTHYSLKAMEEILPANRFVRIHRSYIISIDKLTSINKGSVQIGKQNISVGENYKKHLFDILKIE